MQTKASTDALLTDLTIPPVYGRAGRGAASIIPHLKRQKLTRVSDDPPSEFADSAAEWSVLGPLDGQPGPRR